MAKDPPEKRGIISVLFGRCSELKEIRDQLRDIRRIVMATQEEVDALTAQVGEIKGVLTKIDADIEFLKSQAQNPAITLDALKAAVADLQTSAQVIDEKTPDQPPAQP